MVVFTYLMFRGLLFRVPRNDFVCFIFLHFYIIKFLHCSPDGEPHGFASVFSLNDFHQYELAVDTDKIEVLKKNRGETLEDLTKMHATLNELREANNYDRIEEDWADQPILPIGIQFGNEASDFDIDE